MTVRAQLLSLTEAIFKKKTFPLLSGPLAIYSPWLKSRCPRTHLSPRPVFLTQNPRKGSQDSFPAYSNTSRRARGNTLIKDILRGHLLPSPPLPFPPLPFLYNSLFFSLLPWGRGGVVLSALSGPLLILLSTWCPRYVAPGENPFEDLPNQGQRPLITVVLLLPPFTVITHK